MQHPTPQNRFIGLFKGAVLLILAGLILFSVVRNIRGLSADYPGVSLGWQILIAITITLASFVLAGSSILKSFQAEKAVRWSLFLAGVAFSIVSFRLSYGGAVADAKSKYNVGALQDGEVLQLQSEIDEIVERQQAYGVTAVEKRSLLQREKELRADLREARARANAKAEQERRRSEKAGGVDVFALALFAALPEVGIICFTLVLVLISGQSVFTHTQQAETRLQPLQPQYYPYHIPTHPEENTARYFPVHPQAQKTNRPVQEKPENRTNGAPDQQNKTEPAQIDENWSPFE